MMTTSGQDGDTPFTRDDVSAADAMGRPRHVSVHARNDRIVLKVPPGEVTVLRADEALALAECLYGQASASQPSATVLPFRRKSSPSQPRTGSGT